MKKVLISILFLSLFSIFYAQTSTTKIEVLPDYTSMVMDAAIYEDTIYEAILALSSDNDDDPYNIFINKYIGTEYDSTISIEIPPEQFTTGEFRENGSHYEHLKVFPISKDELCVTVYSCYSNCHFTFLRIKKGKIISKKTYDLSNTSSYENTKYSYNGKDTIYFAYEGQEKFSETKWDTWIMAFDLDGNVKAYKKLFSNESDEINDIVSFSDCVYVNCDFGKWSVKENNVVLKLSKNLELQEVYPYNYGNVKIPYLDLDNSKNKLFVEFGKIAAQGERVHYITCYSSDGKLEGTYIKNNLAEKNQKDESEIYISSEYYLEDGFTVIGWYDTWENLFQNLNQPHYYEYYKYEDFKKVEAYKYTEPFAYNFIGSFYIEGKLFITGYNTTKNDGVSKVSYHTVLNNKVKTKNIPYEYEQVDFDLFEKTPAFTQKAQELSKLIQIKDEKLVQEDSKATASVIKLNWVKANPDDEKILENIPVLPFSER